MLRSLMNPENGTTAENELEALINEGTFSVEKGVVWMIRWNGPDAELTNVRTYYNSVPKQDPSYKDAAITSRNQSVANCRALSFWSVDVQMTTSESVHLVAMFNRL